MLTTILLLISNMALVIWAQLTSPPPIIPTFPPQPTMNPVINKSVVVFAGEPVIVPEDVRVTVNCSQLIDQAISSGVQNPTVKWFKNEIELSNGSAPEVVISADRRFLIITDTSVEVCGHGIVGNYTCNVCGNFTNPNCSKTTHVVVCGAPNLLPPSSPPVVTPTFISITCGQDAVVPTLQGVLFLIIQCVRYNGSDSVPAVFKDGVLISFKDGVYSNSFPLTISSPSNDDFGTYTFSLSTEFCGIATAVSRILHQGQANCSITRIRKRIRHDQATNTTEFRFSANRRLRITYNCKLDDQNFEECKSPIIWNNLSQGRHIIMLWAFCIDDEGNRSPTSSRTFKFRVR